MAIRNFTDRHGNRCTVFTWNNKYLFNSVAAGAEEIEELKAFLPDGTTCVEERDFDYFVAHPELASMASVSKDVFPKRLFIIPKNEAPFLVRIGENIVKGPNDSFVVLSEFDLQRFYEVVERSESDVVV